MNACVFCDIVAGCAPASVVHRDERCMAFMDIRPIAPGHLLVIPNDHAAFLGDLDPDDGRAMFAVAQRLAAALRRSGLPADGINLHVADGAVAGQEIFHVHVHVIPRFAGDGFGLRFPASYGRHPSRSELDAAAARIATGLARS